MTYRPTRIATPHPLHLAIGAVVAAVLLPTLFVVIMIFVFQARAQGVDWDLAERCAGATVLILGPGIIVGLPIAALLRVVAPHSVAAKLAGYIAFVAIAPAYEVYKFPRLDSWMAGIATFAIYALLAIALSRLAARLLRRSTEPTIDQLGKTFD